jgi:uncharacterized glyoxalase superfamily protein PhnB
MTIKGAAEAIEFYKKAFGAEEVSRSMDPSGKFIMHAQIKIGDSPIFIADEVPGMSGPARPAQLWVYLGDVDRAFKRAQDAGCRVLLPLADQFWGDRFGKLVDKWGNEWSLAEHIKDLTPEEMKRAQDAFFAQAAKQPTATGVGKH